MQKEWRINCYVVKVNQQVLVCHFVNMSWQRSFWFRVPLTKQLKRDKAGHGEVTINNAAIVTIDTNHLHYITIYLGSIETDCYT